MFNDEQIIHELWRRGELSWKLHDAQIKIYESLKQSNEKLYVSNCSRRFGKSFLMVLYAIERALQYPNSTIRYGAAFQTDLEEYILPAFDLILSDCPEDVLPTYKAQKSKFIFSNGSEIKLFGVDKNPNSARGNAIDVTILDECGFISNLDYLITSIIYPAMMYKEDAKLILISTPPISVDHDFKMYCEKAQEQGNYSKFTIYDNPMITEKELQECIEESGGITSTTFRREFLCEFVTETDRAIIPEWRDELVQDTPRDEYFQYYKKYASMDTGFHDLTALLFGYYDFKQASLIIEDEFIINGPEVTSENISRNVTEIEESLGYENVRRVADNNDQIFLNDLLTAYGISFVPTNKDSLEAMVNEVRDWVRQGRVKINPKCKQLIGCLESGIWDKQRKKFDRSRVYGHYDALASLIYLIRNIDVHTNPIPFRHGKDLIDWEIRQHEEKQQKKDTMKKILGI